MPDDGDPETEVARLEQLSDEELLAEAAAEGVDVPAEGARVRALLTDAVEAVKLSDLGERRFADAIKEPAQPTTALRELFLIERATGTHKFSDRLGAMLIAAPDAPGALRAGLLSTRPPDLLVLDRPKAAEPEEPIDVILPVATARPARTQAFRPARVNCTPPSEPWVCPPVRLADCPACAAKAGKRCVGFDRWDECHAERVQAL